MAMRDEIKKAIEAGGATKESLLKLTGTTEKGLASQFTYMRMMGNCPMKQEDGTYKIVSADEWENHRASSGSGVNLTPEQRVDKAEKRSKRAATAFDNAKAKHEADPDNKLLDLKFVKANAELQISEIELGMLEETLTANDTPEDAPENEEVEEYYEDEEEGENIDAELE